MKAVAATITLWSLCLIPLDSARAQTAYPMLMSAKPVAAVRGAKSELTLRSRYSMYGAYRVLVSGTDVQAEVVPHAVADGRKIPTLTDLRIRLDVAPQAATGVRDIRVATPSGVSTVGQIVIVNDAVALESAKNNTPQDAQPVTVPATVCGVIERAEDVDFFRFRAEAGQKLCFHVRCMRLQDRIHDLQQHADPLMTLRAANGATLATADNTFFADPLLCYEFDATGEYLLELRDVRYQGNQYWEYCIEITDQPVVTVVHPLGLQPTETAVRFVGYNVPQATGRLVPQSGVIGFQNLAAPLSSTHDIRVPVVVSDLPAVLEEPTANNEIASAQAISIPAGISGRIESEADIDCYRFEAKKGEAFSFEVIARRRQSTLDSLLQITDAAGKRLSEQDDLRLYKHTYADSWIENWTAPADGSYFLHIRDLHLGGSEAHAYFIRATRPRPHFELYLDTDKTQLTPGTSGVLFANAVRKNGFTGEIRLAIEGLPPGVTASCGRIPAGQRDGCVILTAASDAKPDVSRVRVVGIAEHGETPLRAEALVYQETYQPGGGRGHWPVDAHVVALAEAGDVLAVKISPTSLKLKPGTSAKVQVEIKRAEGFTKNVQLDALFRHLSTTYADTLPKGVTVDSAASRTLLTGTNSQGHITFKAAANAAPIENQQVSVMANISLNFVMKWTYSSEPLRISVTD